MTTTKENFVKAIAQCTLFLFDLSEQNDKYTQEERNVWLLKGNAMAELLSRAIREIFTSNGGAEVIDATKKLKAVEDKLNKELNVQKNVVATVKAVADVIAIAEQTLIIVAGLRPPPVG